MIKLSNISKYYHNDGMVTLALHKINLEFKLGEFVAITGESGSGKSTLLNVIAGIDSYEEGELYINGEETSYFDDDDWETYRRDKIAFIFQNYNLIDSYTVLKNVEVALVIQGLTKRERIKKAKEIIARVGLTGHIKHKASKLSGGQKQRLAIARALAKETNIIVADEPTGNLDSESGRQVLELLNEVAKDKLVFIVTHNYDQASPYFSRKIRLFDGEVVEDKIINNKEVEFVEKEGIKPIKDITKAIDIAKFNVFGQPKKSIFLLLVSLAVVFFIFLFYSFMLDVNSEVNTYYPYNEVNSYPERIIVTKKDKTIFSEADFEKLNDSRIDKVIKEDKALDASLNVNAYNDVYNVYFYGKMAYNIKVTKDSLVGSLPTKENEILLNMYYYQDTEGDSISWIIDKEFDFHINYYVGEENLSSAITLKVVGVNLLSGNSNPSYYVTEETLANIQDKIDKAPRYEQFNIYANGVIVGIDYADIEPDESLSGNDVKIENIEIYDGGSINLKGKKLNVIEKLSEGLGKRTIYVSKQLFEEFYQTSNYQYTVNLKNVNDREAVEKYLYNNGFYTYSPAVDVTMDYFGTINSILSVFLALGFVFFMIILYLIGYLIYKLIMNTKIKDYTILRIIGAKKSMISNIIRIELITSFIVAYIIFFVAYTFIKKYIPFLNTFKVMDYIIVFIINIILSILIASRFIKKQVQKSLYTNLRME